MPKAWNSKSELGRMTQRDEENTRYRFAYHARTHEIKDGCEMVRTGYRRISPRQRDNVS